MFDEDADASGVVDEDTSGSNELEVVMTGTIGLFGLDCAVFFCAVTLPDDDDDDDADADADGDGEAELTAVVGTTSFLVVALSLAVAVADCCCRCRCRCVSGGTTAPSATSLA